MKVKTWVKMFWMLSWFRWPVFFTYASPLCLFVDNLSQKKDLSETCEGNTNISCLRFEIQRALLVYVETLILKDNTEFCFFPYFSNITQQLFRDVFYPA